MSEISSNKVSAAYAALNNLEDLAFISADSESKEALVSVWKDLVQKALPPKPKPTMADVEWDDEKHYLAEAEHPEYGKVIMLDMSFITGEVSTLFKKDGVIYSPYVLPENLTPTGKKYKLVEQL